MTGTDESRAGEIWVGEPCHHPAWPRYCDQCCQLAEGLLVNYRISETHAYGIEATVCIRCKRVILRSWYEPEITWKAVLAAVRDEPGFHGFRIVVMYPEAYAAKCVMLLP